MEKHHGQIVEYLVRKNGYSITDLATELSVNRRSIYNYFENKYLKTDIIHKIGCVIRHDFSKEFPELFTPEDFIKNNKANTSGTRYTAGRNNDAENEWRDKYLTLLESYNQALLSKLNAKNLASQDKPCAE